MSSLHFFIAGTPRSRTAWLANLLETRRVHCAHESLARFDTLSAWEHWMRAQPCSIAGECGTLGPLLYPALQKRFPQARWALVHRDPEAVAESLARLGVTQPQLLAMRCERAFQELREQLPHAPIAESAALESESAVRDLWHYVTWGEPFPGDRYHRLRELQVQIAPDQFAPLLEERRPRIAALLAECAMEKEVIP